MLPQEKWVGRVILVNPDGSLIMNRRPTHVDGRPVHFGAGQTQFVGGGYATRTQVEAGKAIRPDKTRKDIARRELEEELGLIVKMGELLFLMASEENGWLSYFFILFLKEPYDQSSMPDHQEFTELVTIAPATIAEYTESDDIAFKNHREALQRYQQVTGQS